ncbi:MAG: hypothetical protein R3C18_24475 [Planctomycetaceae bacterium]
MTIATKIRDFRISLYVCEADSWSGRVYGPFSRNPEDRASNCRERNDTNQNLNCILSGHKPCTSDFVIIRLQLLPLQTAWQSKLYQLIEGLPGQRHPPMLAPARAE